MNFLQDPDIRAISASLHRNARAGRYHVSDLSLQRDGETYQFADLVMEGGGTLGIALVGYIHALEQANIRFLNVGGSSVGSIVALLLACMGDRLEAKGERLSAIVADMDLGALVDGRYFAAKLSKLAGSENPGKHIASMLFCFLMSLGDVRKKLGLNPGDKLYDWIARQLSTFGVSTWADAECRISSMPSGVINGQNRAPLRDYTPGLKIVVADLTTSTKVVFPQMAPMYWQQPDQISPAAFARASSSIPVFFQPYTVTGVSSIVGVSESWKNLCSFEGEVPDRITFADGGLLSNFPIDLFHRRAVPRAPTFGARLGSASRHVKEIKTLGQYGGGLFNALRHYADYDFIFRNPLYKQLIAYIPTDEYNWLDFNMSDASKLGLFKAGMESAYRFLETFDWQLHKQLRAAELEAFSPERLSETLPVSRRASAQ